MCAVSENGLFLCDSCHSLLNLSVLCQVSLSFLSSVFVKDLLEQKLATMSGIFWPSYDSYKMSASPLFVFLQDLGSEATRCVQHSGSLSDLGLYLARFLPDLCQF